MPHVLRHTRATWLLQNGISLRQAASILGMSVEVLERTYGHHHSNWQNAAANVWRAVRCRMTGNELRNLCAVLIQIEPAELAGRSVIREIDHPAFEPDPLCTICRMPEVRVNALPSWSQRRWKGRTDDSTDSRRITRSSITRRFLAVALARLSH
ncbi:hypothetical protein [Hoeflea sp.]|uniref:hypothetical protein n=1 Tax=Hoeflea sp. TaxID=1940281 RepID=UPI003748F202